MFTLRHLVFAVAILLALPWNATSLSRLRAGVASEKQQSFPLWPGRMRRAGASHQSSSPDLSEEPPFKQSMRNIGDAQYTASIQVGGQVLNAIIDTGSFDLLVLSASCTTCADGNMTLLYDSSHSSTYIGSNFSAEFDFGSGTTNSFEAQDVVKIGNMNVPNQVFWEVYEAKMPILMKDSFQAILGVGPPTSAAKFAEFDVQKIHEELAAYTADGSKPTSDIQANVQHYEDIWKHAKDGASVIENLRFENVSVCLGSRSGSEGHMTWNDHRPKMHPDRFTRLDVVGDYYWSVSISDARIGTAKVLKHADGILADEVERERIVGCNGIECSAVIDTGTTFIMAPPTVVSNISSIVEGWLDLGGTCDDISKLPDLEFKLNGVPFSLPPESYIGTIKGSLLEDASRMMPHLLQSPRAGKHQECQMLIMSSGEAESDEIPLWVLGMPFFRKYYTSFHFKQRVGEHPEAVAMSFSLADSRCRPSISVTSAAMQEEFLALRPKSREAQMHVDASKIRIPKVISRMRRGPTSKRRQA